MPYELITDCRTFLLLLLFANRERDTDTDRERDRMCACIHMFVHAIFFSFFHSTLVASSSMGRPLLLFMRAAWRRERKKQARRKKSGGWCSSGKLDSKVLHISCTYFLHWHKKQNFLLNISNKINNKNKTKKSFQCSTLWKKLNFELTALYNITNTKKQSIQWTSTIHRTLSQQHQQENHHHHANPTYLALI